MALTYYDWDGSASSITVPIPCINPAYVHCYELNNGEITSTRVYPKELAYDPDSRYAIFRFSGGIQKNVRFIRHTPYDDLVYNFHEGSTFNLQNYHNLQLQLLHLWQEFIEQDGIVSTSTTNTDSTVNTLVEARVQEALKTQLMAAYEAGVSSNTVYSMSGLSVPSTGDVDDLISISSTGAFSSTVIPDFDSAYINGKDSAVQLFQYLKDVESAGETYEVVGVGTVSNGKSKALAALSGTASTNTSSLLSAVTYTKPFTVVSTKATTLIQRIQLAIVLLNSTNTTYIKNVLDNWDESSVKASTSGTSDSADEGSGG